MLIRCGRVLEIYLWFTHFQCKAKEWLRPAIRLENQSDQFAFKPTGSTNKNSSGDEIANVLVNDDIAHT